jgi:foldase protein PrsA
VTRLRSFPLPTAGAVLVAVLLLGACGTTAGSDAALTVNGVQLSDADFRDELDLLIEHPQFAQIAFDAVPDADNPSVVSQEFAGSVLRLRVFISLVDAEFDRRGLEVTDADLGRADETFGPELVSLLGGLPDDYASRFRHWNAQLLVLRDQLEADAQDRGDEVTDDEVAQFYDEHQGLFTDEQVCARHVLVDTEAEADEVLAELEGGADFGQVATDRSIDPSAQANQGDLGCASRGQYVPPFEEAVWNGPIGEVQGPVETDFGFHVILVDSRGAPGFDELEADIRAFLESPASRQGQQLLNLLIQRMVVSADIAVNAKYGEWDPATQSVVATQAARAGGTGAGS